MEFQNEHLRKVQNFVPEPHQKNAITFFNYLKSLPERRYDLRFLSLAVSRDGIQIVDYHLHYTPVQEYTWRMVKNLLEIEYKPEYVHSPQLQNLFNQLDRSF